MRFLDLYISGFGKFHDTAVSFEDGLNVIYGKNEAGKSTIHTFIRGMLFGIERQRGRAARNDIYSKYEPWENSGTYEGQLRLESDDGTIYRIERSFQKNKKEFTVINETTGREEPDGRAVLQEILKPKFVLLCFRPQFITLIFMRKLCRMFFRINCTNRLPLQRVIDRFTPKIQCTNFCICHRMNTLVLTVWALAFKHIWCQLRTVFTTKPCMTQVKARFNTRKINVVFAVRFRSLIHEGLAQNAIPFC